MSRAYRVTVKDSVRQVVRAEDRVRTQLEVLEILPCAQMSELLAIELTRIGFLREGNQVVREDGNIRTVIDVSTGAVEVSAVEDQEVTVDGKKSGMTYDDRGQSRKQVERTLKQKLEKEIDEGVQRRQSELQQQLTDELESCLADLRHELDQACNRATAEALKIKAAQLGQIKEMTEDPVSGSLTIVVEL